MDPAESSAVSGGILPKRPFVVDTSLFVNTETRRLFGATASEALVAFLEKADAAGRECYVTPSVYREIMGYADIKSLPRAVRGLLIQKEAPLSQQIPGSLLILWVADMRQRIDRGLRVAEKAVRAGKNGETRELIRKLRVDYRRALREDALDSREDAELLLLAADLDGVLITADAGMQKAAGHLGVRMLSSEQAAALVGAGDSGERD